MQGIVPNSLLQPDSPPAGAMKASAPARIVNVSSYRHFAGKLNVKFLSGEERVGFDQTYCSTKLMNVVFTLELAQRLQGTGEHPSHWEAPAAPLELLPRRKVRGGVSTPSLCLPHA